MRTSAKVTSKGLAANFSTILVHIEGEIYKARMKKTITEIFIEVEEFICVESEAWKKSSNEKSEEDLKPVIEICLHCHRAIFETENREIEGDLEI